MYVCKRSSVVHWDLSDKNADTNEIERAAREAVATGGRRGNTNLTVWGGVVEHHIQLASITAQKRKPYSTRVT